LVEVLFKKNRTKPELAIRINPFNVNGMPVPTKSYKTPPSGGPIVKPRFSIKS
jgi:hypothetical protein